MAYMNWEDRYSVGIREIDTQHKKLIAMINDFYEGMKGGKTKEALSAIVDSLLKYAATHFGYEEMYFDKFGYPGTVEHKAIHKAFAEKVTEFKNRIDGGQLILSVEVTDFLKNWLVEHIMGTDQKYSKFLIAKGLS